MLGKEESVELLLHRARLNVGYARYHIALLLDDSAVFADAHFGVVEEEGVVRAAVGVREVARLRREDAQISGTEVLQTPKLVGTKVLGNLKVVVLKN